MMPELVSIGFSLTASLVGVYLGLLLARRFPLVRDRGAPVVMPGIYEITVQFSDGQYERRYFTTPSKAQAFFDAHNPGGYAGDGRRICFVKATTYWNHDIKPTVDDVLNAISARTK